MGTESRRRQRRGKVGIAGFIPGITRDAPGDFWGENSPGSLLHAFQTGILHNLIHLAFGIVGFGLARTHKGARTFLLGGGLVYMVLWFVGMLSAMDWLPADVTDHWLHFVLGIVMLALGFSSGSARRGTTTTAARAGVRGCRSCTPFGSGCDGRPAHPRGTAVHSPCARTSRRAIAAFLHMSRAAPPYAGEGPHALWHVSDNSSIERFEPHLARTSSETEPLVWAIDTRHLPVYWFPRDCPRASFWPTVDTTPDDVEAFCDGAARRVHAIEWTWLERVREAQQLFAYGMPAEPFVPYEEAAGYWVAREPIVPLDVAPLGRLLELHASAGIELRLVPNLWPLWDRVIASSLDFSGVRLRNARARPAPA